MSSRPPRPPPAHSEAPHPRDSVCPGPAAPRLPPRPLSTEQAPLLQTRVGEPSRPGTHPHAGADGVRGLSPTAWTWLRPARQDGRSLLSL